MSWEVVWCAGGCTGCEAFRQVLDEFFSNAVNGYCTMGKNIDLSVGDSVVVKPSVKDPDLGIDIGGWQGRVSEANADEDVICIDWDSMTLKDMPPSIIDKCEEEGWGWTKMYLKPTDVERTEPRDTEEDVDDMAGQIEARHRWSHLGKEGKRIHAVLAGVDPDDEWEVLSTWETHLHQVLRFPFKAEVSEFQESGPLRAGDRVKVHRIVDTDDMYGVLVEVSHKSEQYVFPLGDLESTERRSSNYGFLSDYVVWFANQ